jgi:hypothetical protein
MRPSSTKSGELPHNLQEQPASSPADWGDLPGVPERDQRRYGDPTAQPAPPDNPVVLELLALPKRSVVKLRCDPNLAPGLIGQLIYTPANGAGQRNGRAAVVAFSRSSGTTWVSFQNPRHNNMRAERDTTTAFDDVVRRHTGDLENFDACKLPAFALVEQIDWPHDPSELAVDGAVVIILEPSEGPPEVIVCH